MYINSHNDDDIDNSSNIVAFLDKVLFKNRTKIKKCVYVCMCVPECVTYIHCHVKFSKIYPT